MAPTARDVVLAAYRRLYRESFQMDQQKFSALLSRLTPGQKDALFASMEKSDGAEMNRVCQQVINEHIESLAAAKVEQIIAAGVVTTQEFLEILPYLGKSK
jgi:hypothetical protein